MPWVLVVSAVTTRYLTWRCVYLRQKFVPPSCFLLKLSLKTNRKRIPTLENDWDFLTTLFWPPVESLARTSLINFWSRMFNFVNGTQNWKKSTVHFTAMKDFFLPVFFPFLLQLSSCLCGLWYYWLLGILRRWPCCRLVELLQNLSKLRFLHVS